MDLFDLPLTAIAEASCIGGGFQVGSLLRSGLGARATAFQGRSADRTSDPQPSCIIANVAISPSDRADALELVRERYRPLRYPIAEDHGQRYPDNLRARYYTPIVAKSYDTVIGTVTLGVDSPLGLLADVANKPEADAIRAKGRRIAELVRFAVRPNVDSGEVLKALFQSVYSTCASRLDVTDVVVEVIPRHVPFYCRVFGFSRAAGKKGCERAGGAETVLLWLSRHQFEQRLLRLTCLSTSPRLPEQEYGITTG